MCVSLHPATFSGTIVGTFDSPAGWRHLAYSNIAASLAAPATRGGAPTGVRRSTRGLRSQPGDRSHSFLTAPRRSGGSDWDIPSGGSGDSGAGNGNALILPIPDAFGNIEVIDTTAFGDFVTDIKRALTPVRRGRGSLGGVDRGGDAKSVRIVEFDIYTIVISASAEAIEKALAKVPANRRPALNDKVLGKYTPWYKGWALAVCCFDNREAKRGKPLLFKYKPSKQKDKSKMFIPMLDDHSGNGPDLKAQVDVDHTIFAAAPGMIGGKRVSYSNLAGGHAAQRDLPEFVVGESLSGKYLNGDVIVDRNALTKDGSFKWHRVSPPDAPKTR